MKRVFSIFLLVLIALAAGAQYGDVPAYNAAPPKKGQKQAPILPKKDLWGPHFESPIQVKAYELAARIPDIIYQQPCYCYCDRIGHNSLRSCYETTHAAHCDACLKELYFAYGEYKKGRTAKQIRADIMAGKWRNLDLAKASQTLN